MELFFKIFALLLTLFSGHDASEDTTQEVPDIVQEQLAICGNSLCEEEETCSTCSNDCGLCEEEVLKKIKETIVYVKYEYFAEQGTSNYLQSSASGSGVIIEENENYLFILTNRHVIDCRFTNSCSRIWDENITIRTQDGIVHPVEKMSFDPQFLDIAYLRVRKVNTKTYVTAPIQTKISTNDKVIAAGYPAYKLGGGIVEYSSRSGSIKAIKELLLPNGRLLFSIESDAFTFYGSSGGGFFNDKGELIGISTWGVDVNNPSNSESIAIKIDSLVDTKEFLSCKSDKYLTLRGECKEYYGNNHRVFCFLSDEKKQTPLGGRVYFNGENQGKTVNGCREITFTSLEEHNNIEFDRDYAAGILTYNIAYNYPLTQQFATTWFVE